MHQPAVEIQVVVLQRDQLAGPQASGGREEHHRRVLACQFARDRVEFVSGQWAHLAAFGQRVVDPGLGRVAVDQPPLHGAGEHLTQGLGGLKAMTDTEGHAPGGDLATIELVQAPMTESADRLAQQPAQLLGGLGLGVVLGQVLLHQLGQDDQRPGPAPQTLELTVERGLGLRARSETTTLRALAVTATRPQPVGPQRPTVRSAGLQRQDLSVLHALSRPRQPISGKTPEHGRRGRGSRAPKRPRRFAPRGPR